MLGKHFLRVTALLSFTLFSSGVMSAALLSWKSIDWVSPQIQFPFESGEIHLESGNTYRMEEKFERAVQPFGGVSPQVAHWWQFCVISHFVAKNGHSGWAFTPDIEMAEDKKAITSHFLVAKNADELPESLRSGFYKASPITPMCAAFLKKEYHW